MNNLVIKKDSYHSAKDKKDQHVADDLKKLPDNKKILQASRTSRWWLINTPPAPSLLIK